MIGIRFSLFRSLKLWVLLASASMLFLASPAFLSAESAPTPIKVLIVDGFSNHDWQQNTQLIQAILEKTGLFQVSVSTTPPKADSPGWDTWRPRFKDYDVVMQTCNDINNHITWPKEVQDDFEAYVRAGGGVYVYHSGQNAFASWPAYNEIIGLGWRDKNFGRAMAVTEDEKVIFIPAGEGGGTGHNSRGEVVVRQLGSHPIHEGMPKAWKTPSLEVYFYARGPAENVEVLSYGHDAQTNQNWPVEWTVAYGKGHAYISTFGHVWKGDIDPESMRCVGMQTTMVRALQWLAQRPVTFPVPANFPTDTNLSILPPKPTSKP